MMNMTNQMRIALWLLTLAVLMTTPAAAQDNEAAAERRQTLRQPVVAIDAIEGRIEDDQFIADVKLSVTTYAPGQSLDLMSGDAVLRGLATAGGRALVGEGAADANGRARPASVGYSIETKTYKLTIAGKGEIELVMSIAVRAEVLDDGWGEAAVVLPIADRRPITVASDDAGLEVDLVDAVRVVRKVQGEGDDAKLTVTGLQGSAKSLAVRWRSTVQDLGAELVLASEANTLVTVRDGAMRVDTLLAFGIAQGELESLVLTLPEALNVTQVRGQAIQDWAVVEPKEEGGARELRVSLRLPQTKRYALQVVGEVELGAFPLDKVGVPVVRPPAGIRAGGYVAIGTDSAIALVVERSAGLTQVDAASMPRLALPDSLGRQMPGAAGTGGKVFYYSYTATPYTAELSLARVVPVIDAEHRVVVDAREDGLVYETRVGLEVRDAPVRGVELSLPDGFAVLNVSGQGVSDYQVQEREGQEGGRVLSVQFAEPVIGQVALSIKLESGEPTVGQTRTAQGLSVIGAANQRGYVVVSVADGLAVEAEVSEAMRQVNTASTPFTVERGQAAYRFRETGWSLALTTSKRAATVRAEVFQLVSIGEGVAYGNVAINYFITGAPVDELQVRVDPRVENVQFFGRDVRRFDVDEDDPSLWRVTLQRSVSGDYNLGVGYHQRYRGEGAGLLLVGGVSPMGVQMQTTYAAVASPLDLALSEASGPGTGRTLLPIANDELPGNYSLLVTAPLLKTYKSVGAASVVELDIDAYELGELTPAIIEMAQIHTHVAPGVESGGVAADTESTTTIRYRIKNARRQFLRLQMPGGATGWSVHLIGRDAVGQETRQRLTVSTDTAGGVLMVPLPRPLDPNSPMIVELAYGQVHSGTTGAVSFAAPVADTTTTYESWTLETGGDWAVQPVGGTMRPEVRELRRGQMGVLLGAVGEGWVESFDEAVQNNRIWFALLAWVAIVVLAWIFLRPAALSVMVAGFLLLAVWIGAGASSSWLVQNELDSPDTLNAMTWSRVIEQGGEAGSVIEADFVPEWWFYISLRTLITGASLSLALIFAGVYFRRGRWVLIALGLAGLVYLAGRWPVMEGALTAALTWGVPLLLFLVVLIRLAVHGGKWMSARPVAQSAAAAALIALAFTIVGCATTEEAIPAQVDPVLSHIDCQLSAEQDSMAVDFEFGFIAAKAMRFDLIGGGAVLVSEETGSPNVRIKRSGAGYAVVVDRPGRYNVSASFLLPLAAADAQRVRSFRLPLPPALTNRVTATLPGTSLDVTAPSAIVSQTAEQDGKTTLTATLGPADSVDLRWRPSERRRDLEATVFYCTSSTLLRLAPGSATALHDIGFEVAQGQLSDITITLPENMTVTQVLGESLGAWRFDPKTHQLEAKLTKPVAGAYRMLLTTQSPVDSLPYAIEAGSPRVDGAKRQHATIGLVTAPQVYATMDDAPTAINEQDFARDAALLMLQVQRQSQVAPEIRYACRLDEGESIRATVREVLPEVRSSESASFVIEEERLVYQSEFVVAVSKAGVFKAQLRVPAGYDIDALSANGSTHWDEEPGAKADDASRLITLHYPSRVSGDLPVRVRLSRAFTELAEKIDVPRIEAVGSLKHGGQVVVSATKGVRLSVADREGVSEVNPLELGIRTPGVVAANQLRPDWSLSLAVEQVQPRITADTLHVAAVADGAVRHTVYLHYTLQHAGSKLFRVRVPDDAVGVRLVGPQIARRSAVPGEPGLWEVELASKWYDRPYPLAVQYDTTYEADAATVQIDPVIAVATDLQRGHLSVLAGGRVEVGAAVEAGGMVRADARALPAKFGAGDLSESALCYRCPSAGYGLTLNVRRLVDAQAAQATVEHTRLTTVLTADGESINRAQVQLRVGSKRYLETRLPKGGRLLALRVNARAAEPSTRTDATTKETIYLVPLNESVGEEAAVLVDIVYTAPPTSSTAAASGRLALEGPRFDLPLRDIQWSVYTPEGYVYDDFEGNAAYIEPDYDAMPIQAFSAQAYDDATRQQQAARLAAAQQLQTDATRLADAGDQRRARAALEKAMYFSLGDRALNEDARVQLHRLSTDQAVVGLIGSRGRLRELEGGRVPTPTAPGSAGEADSALMNLSRRDLQQVRAALSRPDGENLAIIAARFMTTQAVAGARPVPLVVEMPLRGQLLEFVRPVQAQPNTPVTVSFTATATPEAEGRRTDWTPWFVAGVLLVLGILIQLTRSLQARRAAAD